MINFYEYYNDGSVLNKYSYMMNFFGLEDVYFWNPELMDDLKPYISIIKKDAKYAHYYARFVLNDRWLEVEPIIIKDPGYAYMYAKYVIKEQWKDAEPGIALNCWSSESYNRTFGTDI